MMRSIGTLSWVEKTGGRLSFRDKAQFLVEAFSARLKRKRGSLDRVLTGISPDELVIPDSALTIKALSYAQELCEPWLVSHSYRTYFWGLIFARGRELKYDRELLFVAAILHDLGITSTFEDGIDGEHCLAVTGARATRDFLETEIVDQRRADIVCEAISLHLNVSVDLGHGAEAHLLHAGAGFDAIRLGPGEISPDAMKKIFELHPISDPSGESMKDRLVPCLLHQQKIRPHSRAALLMRVGFGNLVKQDETM